MTEHTSRNSMYHQGTDRSLVILFVSGKDSKDYLQRMVSCDVTKVSPQQGCRGTLLDGKGRIQAAFDLLQVEGGYMLVTGRDQSEILRSRLMEMVILEDVEIDTQTYQWIHLHGDDAEEGLAQLELEAGPDFLSVRQVNDAWVVRRPRFHPTGFDWIVAANHVDEVTDKLNATADVANDSDRELGRILLGLPKVGAEIGDRTLPPEVGFADAVAYDKGCYAGQEVLARIRTYGHVNREIRRIDFNAEGSGEQQPQVGDDVWPHPNGEKPVAKITSIAKNGESWAAIVSVRYRYLSEAAEDELLVWNPDGEVQLTGTLQQVFAP